MQKLLKILFSPRTTLGLLVLFGIAMAVATFIENSYDTPTAKILVYKAAWFEALMVLMILNFIGSIKRYHLLTWKKISGFLFHFAFAIIIIGAAVTRYFGYEGRMHIREGAASNFIYSSDDYLIVKGNDGTADFIENMPLMMGQNMDNSFKNVVKAGSKGSIDIVYRDHIINATETFEETGKGNIDLLYITLSVQGHKDEMVIRKGELKMNHDFPVAYNNNSNPNAILITGQGDSLVVRYPHQIQVKAMPSMAESVIPAAQNGSFERMHLYEPEGSGVALVLTNHVKNASVKYVAGPEDQNTPDALIMDVTFNGVTKEATVLGGSGYLENFHKVSFDDLDLEISYGAKRIDLPFAVKLNDFQLERYDGSMSPSSYASEVTLIDEANNVSFDHRIFMNNILDYGGYRFFQSSYDQDERGTILSVNHDWWGTIITYLGYALMIIGFVWTLFNPHSRYWDLMKKIRHLRERRKALSIILIAFASSLISAQQSTQNHTHQENPYAVSREHADKFAEMMVLTYEGRYAPINTLAIDVMHKISRKDIINIPARGEMTANQLFLDIPLNVEFWKNQKIIYIREEAVSDLLGITETYASFNTFFNEKGEYLLREYAEKAFQKPEGERNKLDKEVIKINERLEIFMMTHQGALLDIFPVQDSPDKWISWEDKLATTELQGSIRIINDDLQLPQVNYQQIMRLYFKETYDATRSGDYSRPDKILGYIKSIQRQLGNAEELPSDTKIQREISYNNSNIFINLRNLYSLLSVLLLFLAFIDNLRSRPNKVLTIVLNVFIAILFVGFLYHTYGMAMRWYLSGHAPWSNGYEALILVAWASLLAGFSFSRYSKITLAATALLAFFTLMTASHSSYDPQLTNLQPVLKSYWLIVHVATLTISYGFLGLGLVLGLFNMLIYILKTNKNYKRLSLITRELTYVNEMTITIGLLLATIGTFLGGVWANESWGRYWGWDAKETWALVITIVYTIIIHMRLAPRIKGEFIFNVATIFGFGSVLMTFIGVNYYFTKGMHSYASGDTPVFPIWAWVMVASIILLIVIAGINKRRINKHQYQVEDS